MAITMNRIIFSQKGSLIFTLLVLVSCKTLGPTLIADTTNFYIDGFETNGSIAVVAGDKIVGSTLEFNHYKKKFEDKLASLGYEVKSKPFESDFIAYITYGIDDGATKSVSTPIYGQTGGGTTYTSGTVTSSGGSGTYSGTSYTMPSYGVVGSSSGSYETYKRAIAMDIVKLKRDNHENFSRIFEGRTKSTGTCNVIVEVFDEMLDAMFEDFPGENGKNRRRSVPAIAEC